MASDALRIVFMGSPAFAVPSLRALLAANYKVVAVVTQPNRRAGRGGTVHAPEVKTEALANGLPVLQPESLRDAIVQENLASLEADAFVVAAYGRILPRAVLAMPRLGCLNVHASLLPRWRGPSPISAAILAGDQETGVSIMELAPKMDTGPVLGRRAQPIGPDDTAASLEPRLAALGAILLMELLPRWASGELVAQPQEEQLATYCPLLTKSDSLLRLDMPVRAAERAVRAFDPWPGAFVTYRGERLGIWRAHVLESPGEGQQVGAMALVGRDPAIVFTDGLLVLDEVQKAGGRRVTGAAFVAGERGKMDPAPVLV